LLLTRLLLLLLLMCAGRVEISSQNHNFAVDPQSLPEGVEVTHINLNDGTCAGMMYPAKKAMTIQYHPEASPGPHDADICFEQFVQMMVAESLVKA
jgi:carbamoyl-phosphate synthase small subunit